MFSNIAPTNVSFWSSFFFAGHMRGSIMISILIPLAKGPSAAVSETFPSALEEECNNIDTQLMERIRLTRWDG